MLVAVLEILDIRKRRQHGQMASYERQGQGENAEGIHTTYDKRHGQRWPQQGQRNAPELLPRTGAISTRCLVELTRDGLQTGEEDEHDRSEERRVGKECRARRGGEV